MSPVRTKLIPLGRRWNAQLGWRRQLMVLSPAALRSPELRASLHPELRCKVVTNQHILKPVWPVFLQPEVGVLQACVTVTVTHIFAKSIRSGNRPQSSGDTLRFFSVALP